MFSSAFYLAKMPSKSHRKYCGQRHCGRSPQRQSPWLLLHSLPPHQCNNYQCECVTPPTHLQDSGRQNALLSAEVYVFLLSLPPHRRQEFLRRRDWFQLTMLELVDSIPAPPHRHWEYNHHYNFAGIYERRFAEDNALAALEHLYVNDTASYSAEWTDWRKTQTRIDWGLFDLT